MIFTRFDAALAVTMSLMIFHNIDHGSAGENEDLGSEKIPANGKKLPKKILDQSLAAARQKAYDNKSMLFEEKEVQTKCKVKLGKHFKGTMFNDAFEVDENNCNAPEDVNIPQCTKDAVPRYKSFMQHVLVRIPTTDTNLISFYCEKIDPLLRLGYTGDFEHDQQIAQADTATANKLNGNKDPNITDDSAKGAGLVRVFKYGYNKFITQQETIDNYNKFVQVYVTKINMLFQFSLLCNWINNPVQRKTIKCKTNLRAAGYDGTLDNFQQVKNGIKTPIDYIAPADPTEIVEYEGDGEDFENYKPKPPKVDEDDQLTDGNEQKFTEFVEYLKANKVEKTDKDLVLVYCDITDLLRREGFTGKKIEDLEKKNAKPKLTDLVNGYHYFLNKVEDLDKCADDLTMKYTLYRINIL